MADIITFIGEDTPGDLSVAANYDPAQVPVATDHLHFDARSGDVSASFDEFDEVALGSVHFHATWTNKCVTTAANEYIQFDTTTVWIGEDDGATPSAGSPRLKVDVGGAEPTIHVLRTSGSSEDDNQPPVRVLMAHNAASLYVRSGEVGVAIDRADETSTLGLIDLADDATVTVGAGVTLSNYQQTGGQGVVYCAMSGTIKIKGGTLTTEGTGALATVTQDAGTMISNSTGTVTTYNLNDGTCDTLQSNVSRTFTTVNQAGGQLKKDNSVLTVGTHNVTGRASTSVTAA